MSPKRKGFALGFEQGVRAQTTLQLLGEIFIVSGGGNFLPADRAPRNTHDVELCVGECHVDRCCLQQVGRNLFGLFSHCLGAL